MGVDLKNHRFAVGLPPEWGRHLEAKGHDAEATVPVLPNQTVDDEKKLPSIPGGNVTKFTPDTALSSEHGTRVGTSKLKDTMRDPRELSSIELSDARVYAA